MTLNDLLASAAKLRDMHAMRCTAAKHDNPKQRHVECLALDLADELTRRMQAEIDEAQAAIAAARQGATTI